MLPTAMRHFASKAEVNEFIVATDVDRLRELLRGLDLYDAHEPLNEFSGNDLDLLVTLRDWGAHFRAVAGLKIQKHSR